MSKEGDDIRKIPDLDPKIKNAIAEIADTAKNGIGETLFEDLRAVIAARQKAPPADVVTSGVRNLAEGIVSDVRNVAGDIVLAVEKDGKLEDLRAVIAARNLAGDIVLAVEENDKLREPFARLVNDTLTANDVNLLLDKVRDTKVEITPEKVARPIELWYPGAMHRDDVFNALAKAVETSVTDAVAPPLPTPKQDVKKGIAPERR